MEKLKKTIAKFPQGELIEEVLRNDLRRTEAKSYIENSRGNPYRMEHGHINGVPLYILDEAIKVFESNLRK